MTQSIGGLLRLVHQGCDYRVDSVLPTQISHRCTKRNKPYVKTHTHLRLMET